MGDWLDVGVGGEGGQKSSQVFDVSNRVPGAVYEAVDTGGVAGFSSVLLLFV